MSYFNLTHDFCLGTVVDIDISTSGSGIVPRERLFRPPPPLPPFWLSGKRNGDDDTKAKAESISEQEEREREREREGNTLKTEDYFPIRFFSFLYRWRFSFFFSISRGFEKRLKMGEEEGLTLLQACHSFRGMLTPETHPAKV